MLRAGDTIDRGLGEADANCFAKDVIERARVVEVGVVELGGALCAVSGSDLKLRCISRNTRLQGDLTILGQTAPLKEPDLLPKILPPMAFPKEILRIFAGPFSIDTDRRFDF